MGNENSNTFLIVGLGNPEDKYRLNRHNIGWQVFDHFRDINDERWTQKFKGIYTRFKYQDKTFYFLKPLTYMNDSGISVRAIVDFFKISVNNILVIYDELDIDYGSIQFKKGGGTAGHNGLKSMVTHLGSKDFMRVRMGISRPGDGNISKWVLSDFSKVEQKDLEYFLDLGVDALELFMKEGYEKAANKLSKKSVIINK